MVPLSGMIRATEPREPTLIPYRDFVKEYKGLDREAFLAKVRDPHLVLHTTLNPEESDEPTARFLTIQFRPSQAGEVDAGPQAVIPVVKRHGANAFTMMITIGRAMNNDIVLPDARVSKFHCYLRRVGASWVVSDANSTNGTKVEEVELPTERSLPLRSGAQLVLGGTLVLEFLEPAALHERIRQA